jgi:predicted nucleic acid-binding protein
MIVCIDTNTVIQALAQHHPFHPILDTWVAGRLTWAVSTPILLEYEEVLTRLSGPARWRKLARVMDLAELTSGNLLRVTPSFQFRVVTADPDDNIFRTAPSQPTPTTCSRKTVISPPWLGLVTNHVLSRRRSFKRVSLPLAPQKVCDARGLGCSLS